MPNVHEDGPWKVIQAGSDLTDAEARELQAMLSELYEQGARQFCLDLSQVSDIRASGLTLLAMLARWARQEGEIELAVSEAAPEIVNLFKMTGLDRTYALS